MSSTVRVPGNTRCAPRPWHKISLLHRLLGEGQGLAAVARADEAHLFDGRARRTLDGLEQGLARSAAVLCREAMRRAAQDGTEVARLQLGLDVEDGAVEHTGEALVADRALARRGHALCGAHVAGGSQIAEEVAAATGLFAEQRRSLALHRADHVPDGGRQLAAVADEAQALQHLLHLFVQLAQLVQVDLEPEGLAQGVFPLRRLAAEHRRTPLELTLEHGETSRGQRLFSRHRAGHLVVRAAVGDAPAHDPPLLVEQDGLGGGAAQIDSDDDSHALALDLRASSICR
jgi:hypothetical protein